MSPRRFESRASFFNAAVVHTDANGRGVLPPRSPNTLARRATSRVSLRANNNRSLFERLTLKTKAGRKLNEDFLPFFLARHRASQAFVEGLADVRVTRAAATTAAEPPALVASVAKQSSRRAYHTVGLVSRSFSGVRAPAAARAHTLRGARR